MANSVDIDLLPIYRRAGQDQASLPGLVAARKPRRSARSREFDQLIVHLSLVGNATLPLNMQEQLVDDLVRTYFDTSGSVTAALRASTDMLNQLLLKRNVQSSGSGQQTVAMLSLAALRGDQFYLAQSGPVFALYLSAAAAEELNDTALSGRGLGINQSTPIRYFHASLAPGEVLLLAAHPPTAWNTAALADLYGQALVYQQSRLLDQVLDANGALLHVKPGSGQVVLLPARPVQQQPPRSAAPLPPAPAYIEESNEDLVRQQAMLDQYQPLPELEISPVPALPLASDAVSVSSPPRLAAPAQPAPTAPPRAAAPSEKKGPGPLQKFSRALAAGLNRLLPEDALASIPNSVMAGMALVIPLVIVAMAAAVYFQRGLAAQSEIAYSQAVQAVAQAQVQLEPAQRREGLTASLSYLDAADSYKRLPEVQTLRQQILADLDTLDLIRRLDYQPAVIGGLPDGVSVTRLLSIGSDLYMLDGSTGKVLRAFFTNQGYQLDPGFQCGPGSPVNIGPLIDIAAWQTGSSPNPSILAMDAAGMLLFCRPEEAPQPKKLSSPPTGELNGLTGFALYQNDLYVLEPGKNAVWVYYNGDFEGEPAYYFSDAVPPLADVVDLAATNEELYLLHSDGRMTLCVTGSLGVVTPNRCTDSIPYIDMRLGRESLPLAVVPNYSQMQYSPPPDPSLYLLEPTNQAIDRYSLRNLAYQSRYLPQTALSPATAAWVDPVERLVFLAAGGRVYYANQP